MGEILLTADSPLPVAKVAVQVAEPEVGYDRFIWSLAANSRVSPRPDMNLVLTYIPARVLKDGTIEQAPEHMRRSVVMDSMIDARTNELTPLGKLLIVAIEAAIEQDSKE